MIGIVDEPELLQRISRTLAGWGAGQSVERLRPLEGGASSLTFAATIDGPQTTDIPIVLKVAPPGLPPVKNRDVLRQARVMRALSSAPDVRVPKVLFEDEGEPPEMPPFFAMAFVEGESVEPILADIDELPVASEVRARELDAARILGALHRVSPRSLGLGGEEVIKLDQEVDRWIRLYKTVTTDLWPIAQDVGSRLLDTTPTFGRIAIVHGDFRLGNALSHHGRVEAIIDWEIWTVGDSRIDLSWYLMNTDPSKQPTGVRVAPGMPSDDELITTYESSLGERLADMAWFHGLSRFKGGAITAQIIKHNARRPVPDARIASWESYVPRNYLESAREFLNSV